MLKGPAGFLACYTNTDDKDVCVSFGYDACNLVNHMLSVIDAYDVWEIHVKLYLNGVMIHDGEMNEVEALPKVQQYLPPGWKNQNKVRRDERNQEVAAYEAGEKFSNVCACYKGDILFEHKTWQHHRRPAGLDGKKWESPFTISFQRARLNSRYGFESPTYWTVVEEKDLIDLQNKWGTYTAKIPHHIYTLPENMIMLQDSLFGFGLDEQGRLVVDWID